MTTRTYTPRASEIERQWFVVDADGQTLGRLASRIARLLAGKHKPGFATHIDTGDHVIVVNAGKHRDRRQDRPPSPTRATAAIPAASARSASATCSPGGPRRSSAAPSRACCRATSWARSSFASSRSTPDRSIRTRRSDRATLTTEVPERMTTPQFYQGTGRRKTSVARVRLVAGEGEVVVNGRTLEEHFGNAVSLPDVLMPFRVTNTEGRFNAMVKVEGGGITARPGRSATASPGPCWRPTPRRAPALCAGRLPHARPAHEGAQEVRPEARPQGTAVHQALMVDAGGPVAARASAYPGGPIPSAPCAASPCAG